MSGVRRAERTKAQVVEGLQKHKPNVDAWEIPEEGRVFHVSGDMALETGSEHIVQHDADGKSSDHRFRYTTVYVRRDGRWLALADHLTDIPAPPPEAAAPATVPDSINALAVTGNRAYVVTTASSDWKESGKPMKEEASRWTFALQKSGKGVAHRRLDLEPVAVTGRLAVRAWGRDSSPRVRDFE